MDEQLDMTDQDFNALMNRIDQRLSGDGVSIPNRPILALGLISEEYPVHIPITKPYQGAPEHVSKNWPFTARVYDWFHRRYGERLKKHCGPGRMVILIRNDPWVIRLPRIMGGVNAVISRTAVSEGMTVRGRLPLYNILDSIENLTAGMKESLTEEDLENIFRFFQMGYAGFMMLEELCSYQLIESALSDLDATVEHVMVRNPNYGLSKWASLQTVEKVLKAGIEIYGGSFPKIHDLKSLSAEATELGIAVPSQDLLSRVQCSPSIRYGNPQPNLIEAVDAHHAAIEISLVVTEQLVRKRS
jgi:hypothetical protein